MANPNRRANVSDDDIVAAYLRIGGAKRTAKELGVSETLVFRVLVKRGVPRTGTERTRRERTKFQGQEQEIRSAYEAGATLGALRERFGADSDYSIKHAIRRAGGILRVNPAPTIKPGELDEIRRLNSEGFGQVAISLKLGRSQSFISRAMRRNGIKPNSPTGHGRHVDGNGYMIVFVHPEDPLASMRRQNGYVPEHRFVMARHLGRPLLERESVHHINGNKTDNRIENLQLRQGKHGKHEAMCCLDCGSQRIGPCPIKD